MLTLAYMCMSDCLQNQDCLTTGKNDGTLFDDLAYKVLCVQLFI